MVIFKKLPKRNPGIGGLDPWGCTIQSALSLGSWFGYVLFGNLLCFNVMWRLCDRYAAKSGSAVLDFAKSTLLFIVFFFVFFGDLALTEFLYTTTLWGGIAFAAASFPTVLLLYGKCRCTRTGIQLAVHD